ncbi:hypothetical protein ACU5CE_33065 [Priestia megaterium]|uniref:hypothetical protein n=1 Tax=Priestia megaterium TaxID=1404 RepID=UPI00406BBEE1
MIIVVLSHNQTAAKRIWKDKLSKRFSGYQHVKFNPNLRNGLDGFDLTRMVFVYTGGYAPRNKDEAMAIAWYLDNGVMLIDANDRERS